MGLLVRPATFQAPAPWIARESWLPKATRTRRTISCLHGSHALPVGTMATLATWHLVHTLHHKLLEAGLASPSSEAAERQTTHHIPWQIRRCQEVQHQDRPSFLIFRRALRGVRSPTIHKLTATRPQSQHPPSGAPGQHRRLQSSRPSNRPKPRRPRQRLQAHAASRASTSTLPAGIRSGCQLQCPLRPASDLPASLSGRYLEAGPATGEGNRCQEVPSSAASSAATVLRPVRRWTSGASPTSRTMTGLSSASLGASGHLQKQRAAERSPTTLWSWQAWTGSEQAKHSPLERSKRQCETMPRLQLGRSRRSL